MQCDLLSEFYRCSRAANCFDPPADVSGEKGFFAWGKAIGYGGCSKGTLRRSCTDDLCDLSEYSVWHEGRCDLAFDPWEVAENLRREKYFQVPQRGFRWLDDLIRNVYYGVRPYLTVRSRRPLQRLYLRAWREVSFPRWPVDTSVEKLCEMLMAQACEREGNLGIPFIWFWPNAAEGCLIMTHDVEEAPGRDFCSNLMDLDESHGIPAAFQIVPEQRYEVPFGFLDEIRRRGFEVNVQDLNHDGMLFRDRAEFVRRAARIEKYRLEFKANGFRSAVMYRNQDWYDLLHFQFDMSVPNVAHLDPQRGGCCTAMPYFVGHMLEIPLTTTQDYSLFHILGEYSISLWKQQVDLILKTNGLISFAVHPDYIRGARERAVYIQLLSYLDQLRVDRKLWVTLPGEVDEWWRQRAVMELVQEGSEWAIRGPGSERARIAYARVSEGDLVYEIPPKEQSLRTGDFRSQTGLSDWPKPSAEPEHLESGDGETLSA
jgi:hypothetical protein